jgi:hypothetical protein
MMLSGEKPLPVDHAVCGHIGPDMGGIHSPPHHAGTPFGAKIGCYGPIAGYPALRDEFNYLIDIVKEILHTEFWCDRKLKDRTEHSPKSCDLPQCFPIGNDIFEFQLYPSFSK